MSEFAPSSSLPPDPRRNRFVGAVVLLGLVAAGLRLGGAFNDLWLDEIWSLNAAREVKSPLGVFTSLHHEINHHLNTLWLYFAGEQASAIVYRLPALVAGAGVVWVAMAIGGLKSRAGALCFGAVTAFSYPLILYSSEARGYATATLAAVAAYYFLLRFLRERRWPLAAVFAATEMLGLVSHLMFLSVMMATVVWSGVALLRGGTTVRKYGAAMAACHTLPWLLLGWLYAVDIRLLANGGGTTTISLIDSFGSSLAWAVGGNTDDAWKIVPCLVGAAVVARGVQRMWNESRDEVIFFMMVVVIAPLALVLVRRSDAVYTRHFLLSMTFVGLLLAEQLTEGFGGGRRARAASACLMAVFVAANAWPTLTFFQAGRGDFRRAIQLMVNASPGQAPVRIGGEHDFRVAVSLNYFGPRLNLTRPIIYYKADHWPAEGTDFILANRDSQERSAPPVPRLADKFRHEYAFKIAIPAAPLSGLHWYIYQRVPGS